MNSLAPFQLTLSSTVVHINRCFNAFLAFVFSLESIETRLDHILNYISSLQQGILMRTGDVDEVLLQKIMIGDGITTFLCIAKSIVKELKSRSRQDVGVPELDFRYSKQMEMGLGSYQLEFNLNHLIRQAKMSIEDRGANLFQHNLSSIQRERGVYPMTPMNRNLGQFQREELTNVASGSRMALAPLETYTQVMPANFNTNLAAPFRTNITYARLANQPMSRTNIQMQQRKVWTKQLQAKFKNAVQMLGGPRLATPIHIWRVMKDETLTVDQVRSYLQSYRDKEKQTTDKLKAFQDMISAPQRFKKTK